MAAAAVNPPITGFDKKLTRKPKRKNPNKMRITPSMKAKRIASSTKYSEPTSAKALTPANTNKESIATGPTANCLLVPKRA